MGIVSRLFSVFLLSLIGLAMVAPVEAASRYAALVVDAKTGKVLFSRHADAPRYPASLTKMMTLYILFEEIDQGRFHMGSQLKVTSRAARQPPSKLGLAPGSTISVRAAIGALAVKSANDAAVVVAENIAGTETKFAHRMTRTARKLGMNDTTFRNASGLPNSRQKTTARDMARLGLALQDRFPKFYKYFGERTFSYNERTYRNHNSLLGRVAGVDGIKTGYTRASGFNLVSSVRHNDRHVIAVVLGGRTGRSRDAHMRELIGQHLMRAKPGRRTAPRIGTGRHTRLGEIPLPRSKPQDHVLLASTAPRPEPRSPAALQRDADLIAAWISQDEENGHDQGPAPAGPSDIAALIAAKEAGLPDHGRPMSGSWHIHIGATPSEEGALALLELASVKGPAVLERAEPVMQQVYKPDGEMFFRARFAGFHGYGEADAACNFLRSQDVHCLAVPE